MWKIPDWKSVKHIDLDLLPLTRGGMPGMFGFCQSGTAESARQFQAAKHIAKGCCVRNLKFTRAKTFKV